MFIVKLYDHYGDHKIGSDNTLYLRLKTIKGAIKRVKSLDLKNKYYFYELYIKRDQFSSNSDNKDYYILKEYL